MMKLTLKKGAIVRFAFNCNTTGMVTSGKIVDITDDEVIICPQIMIQHPDDNGVYTYTLSQMIIDPFCSMDSGREFHIDRAVIAGWEYEPIRPDIIYSETVRDKDIDIEIEKLNNYNPKTGFCTGK